MGNILSELDVKKINTLYKCEEYPQLFKQNGTKKNKNGPKKNNFEHTTPRFRGNSKKNTERTTPRIRNHRQGYI